MSWGTSYQTSNNIHFNFPAIMEDGRNYTSYDMAPILDKSLKEKAGINTNTDYRRYLQSNADSIIKSNQMSACLEIGTVYYSDPMQEPNGSPYIFKSTLSNDRPYGYESSDLKNLYLTREQLNAQKYAPRFTI